MQSRLLCSFLCCIAFQCIYADADLDRVKTTFDAEINRITATARRNYETELRKLLERQTKAANLNAALETRMELEKLTGKKEGAAAAKHETLAKEIETVAFEKTWQAPKGTKFTFRKSGTCVREFENKKTLLKWRPRGPDVIELSGDTPADNHFFRCGSPGEAY